MSDNEFLNLEGKEGCKLAESIICTGLTVWQIDNIRVFSKWLRNKTFIGSDEQGGSKGEKLWNLFHGLPEDTYT